MTSTLKRAVMKNLAQPHPVPKTAAVETFRRRPMNRRRLTESSNGKRRTVVEWPQCHLTGCRQFLKAFFDRSSQAIHSGRRIALQSRIGVKQHFSAVSVNNPDLQLQKGPLSTHEQRECFFAGR